MTRDSSDEKQLLQRLKAGEDAAYEELVRAQGGRMLAAAQRMLHSDDEARDAVQEAFGSAFKAIQGFEGHSRLSTWLHRIVVNAALMKLRSRQGVTERSIDELLPSFFEDGHIQSPASPWRDLGDDPAERRELAKIMLDAIDSLPESYRSVLLLRDVEELDTRETAQIMGLQAGAVKTRLHRARQALRGLLEAHLTEVQP
jgi:RNA polymerase sigma-70 factor (ECF subfamily)